MERRSTPEKNQACEDPRLSGALAAWATADDARALHPLDREVVRATASARSLVLDLFGAASPRDLFNACARLGGLIATGGGSPSLAASAIDGAAWALAEAGVDCDPARVGPARAACFEGYVAAIREAERAAALAAWEYPHCVVAIPGAGDELAIACGYPETDGEAVAAWAGRVASRLVKSGARSVVLDGGANERARAEIQSAVELVGIKVRGAGPVPGAAEKPKSWLPWRR